MKYRILVILLFVSGVTSAQGLNSELGFNDNYDQASKALVCVEDNTYLIKFQKSSSFYSTCTLNKIDTVGNVIANSLLNSVFVEFTDVYEMIPSEANGVYILGFGMPTCDVGQDCFWFIQKFNASGNLDWSMSWMDYTCSLTTPLTGLSLTANNELLVNYKDSSANSFVYTITSNGFLIDSVQIAHAPFSGFCELTGYEFIGYKGDSLCAFDMTGTLVNTIEFSTGIQNISSANDTLYVLTTDSIFIFDSNLAVLQGTDVSGYSTYSNLKHAANTIQFVSSSTDSLTILKLNKQLQLQNTSSIPVSSNAVTHLDYSDSHFSIAFDFPLTLHHTVRYLDYSLNSLQNATVNTSDIGVCDVDITQTSLQQQGSGGVYSYQLWGSALVKNYGTKVVNSCRINHRISPLAICSEYFYTNEFTNLNLAPNDSIWINLGLFHALINYFPDTIDVDICVYTSYPNQVTDTLIQNDPYCSNILLGFVGMEENQLQSISLSPNPVKDILNIENPELLNLSIYIYNNLGQVVLYDSRSESSFDLDLTNQNTGVYLVRLVSKNMEITKKVVKQ